METPLALKPLLATLVLPASSGLLALALVLLAALRPGLRPRARRALLWVGLLLCAGMWLFASQATSVWLARHLLPQVEAVTPQALTARGVQAIVVLGGGAERNAIEYQADAAVTLPPDALARLHYGAYLRHASGLPLAYSGGVGWAAGTQPDTGEAEIADRTLQRLGLAPLRWRENASRDTHENAQQTRALLPADVTRIALVTHAWHMPRAERAFTAAGFEVTPAPMGFVRSELQPVLQWLPSGGGWRDSQRVLREWLALRVR